jgi:uncharacterized protein YjbJ (UPF0337 family)
LQKLATSPGGEGLYRQPSEGAIVRVNLEPGNFAGLYDKVLGLGKEVVGTVLGEDSWVHAGEAQQDKGKEKLKALRAQARADSHAARAKAAETRQRAAQHTS